MKGARRYFPKRVLSVAALLTAVSATMVLAHDFWIVPISFTVASGNVLEVLGQTGSKFPTSQSAVQTERVAEARLIGASQDERVTDFSVRERSLLLRHKPQGAGQRVVAVSLIPSSRRVPVAGLKRYIGLEGAPELAQQLEKDGAFPNVDSVAQRSQKFAKAVLEVGEGGPRAFSKTVGHALELVPMNDPAALHAGHTIDVKLLYHGRPVANAYLRAGLAPKDTTVASRDTTLITNAEGIARLSIRESGLWNVRSLHAAPAANVPNEWEVFFVTLVFNARAGLGPGR